MVAGVIPLLTLHPVGGVRMATACAGIKRRTRDDVSVFELAAGSTCAAVFTRNAFCAAPVILARQHLSAQSPRYWLINSGNANAGTGVRGLQDARSTCQQLAALAGVAETAVLPFSTGVIGQPLPVGLIAEVLPGALKNLSAQDWEAAAHAIMTTDTLPKACSRQLTVAGKTVTITGIAKGAGMIRPDMATMLAFMATDAAVRTADLQAVLTTAIAQSFNCITVDGDTSTNDACVFAASGSSGIQLTPQHPQWQTFTSAVNSVCRFLAEAIVRDGEGATKFMRIVVTHGRDDAECRRVADAVAHSPLVKTAFFAADANWGRILAAVGRAGISDFNIQTVTIDLNNVRIVEEGGGAAGYTEARGQAAMQATDITVNINLARGQAAAEVLTCDFSTDYVRINAEYRT